MKITRKQIRNLIKEALLTEGSFTYSVIEDELDGGPTVEINGIPTTYEEMIGSLEGQTLDFDDGEGPFQFNIEDFGGEPWNLVRNGIAGYYVELWAEMNGHTARRTGAFH